jgi:hypothetical protein
MSKLSTPRSMTAPGAATGPQLGCGVGAHLQMDLAFPVGDVADHLPGVYGAIADTVDECMGGTVAFAALMEERVPDVSRRLRRGDDGKGNRMHARADYLAGFATSHAARLVFVNKLCAAWHLKPTEPMSELTPEEKLKILASELPEKRRRQLEREHGLPAGSLEP